MPAKRTTSRPDDVAWFERTAHCGLCGNPGDYCTCTDSTPCGCYQLHVVGSARLPDALDQFQPDAVAIEQDDLFGGPP